MSSFPSPGTQMVQQATQSQNQRLSGWDAFLQGAQDVGRNFLVGFGTGLASYRSDNPYSSLAGGILGATKGMQQDISNQVEASRAAQQRTSDILGGLAKAATLSEIQAQQTEQQNAQWRSQVEGATSVPGLQGLMTGIGQAPTRQAGVPSGFGQLPFDFNPRGIPSAVVPEFTASGTTARLIGGGPQR